MTKKTKGEGLSTFESFFSPKSAPLKPTGGSTNAPQEIITQAEIKPTVKPVQAIIKVIQPAAAGPKKSVVSTSVGSIPMPPHFITPFKCKSRGKNTKGVIAPASKTIPERTEPIIDLSKYHEPSGEKHVQHDGIVYYCRACKNHFTGPILFKVLPGPVGCITHLKQCPLCMACENNDTHNTTTSKENTCETCGTSLGMFCGTRLTTDPICFNCNRDLLEIPKYKKLWCT